MTLLFLLLGVLIVGLSSPIIVILISLAVYCMSKPIKRPLNYPKERPRPRYYDK